MKRIETGIPDLILIEPDVFGDHRGWFTETYSVRKYAELGITAVFIQDNQSYSAQKGTLRGLHFQRGNSAQAKLVRCVRGTLYDVVVDLRECSPTYRNWFGVELSASNHKQLFVPKGFAHGFVTLSDDVEIEYKVDAYYSKDDDGGIRYDDPAIGIDWTPHLKGLKPVLSDKDSRLPTLEEAQPGFVFPKDSA